MVSSVSPIRSAQHRGGGQDDGRDRLRQAVALHRKAKARIGEHADAIDRARDLLVEVEKRAEHAASAVSRERDKNARRLAEALTAGKDSAVNTNIDKQALALVGIEESVETARRALERLKAATVHIEAAVLEAHVNVSNAIDELVLPVAQRAFARLREIDAERFRLAVLLRFTQESRGKVTSSPLGSTHMLQMERKLHAPLDTLRSELSDYFSRSIVPEVTET